MSRVCRILLWVGFAFGLITFFAAGASAQFSDDEIVIDAPPAAPAKTAPSVPLPVRKPAKPPQTAATTEDEPAPQTHAAASDETGSRVDAPVKKPTPKVLATFAHETGTETDAPDPGPDITTDHEQRAADEKDAEAAPEPGKRKKATVPLPARFARDSGDADKDPSPTSNTPVRSPAAKAETRPTGVAARTESQAEPKPPRRKVAVPPRKPLKPRNRPEEAERQKLPRAGEQKTRKQQCAALTICRQAFAKCRFSKEREQTDEEGWEVHKKYCGDVYSKCISRHFAEGELFFTRWFLPYDPCS